MKHKHHILPLYRGGADDRNNLIEISVTRHAMFHYCNWQLWGDDRDKTAWLGLRKLNQYPKSFEHSPLDAIHGELAKIDKIIKGLKEVALSLGLKESDNDWNYFQAVSRKIKETVELEHKAKELGYQSLAVALKALSQFKR